MPSGHASSLSEIAGRVGENYIAHGLVIFDVTGASAKVTVERLGNGRLEIVARDRLFCQTVEQHLPLVQKTGRAIAALERKVFDKALLQSRDNTIFCVPLDRADGFAVEVDRSDDASR